MGDSDHGLPLLVILVVKLFAIRCFLLQRRTKENMSPLLMAIRLQLEPVVDALCKRGVDVNSSDENGNTPIWIALKSRQMDTAATLVRLVYLVPSRFSYTNYS